MSSKMTESPRAREGHHARRGVAQLVAVRKGKMHTSFQSGGRRGSLDSPKPAASGNRERQPNSARGDPTPSRKSPRGILRRHRTNDARYGARRSMDGSSTELLSNAPRSLDQSQQQQPTDGEGDSTAESVAPAFRVQRNGASRSTSTRSVGPGPSAIAVGRADSQSPRSPQTPIAPHTPHGNTRTKAYLNRLLVDDGASVDPGGLSPSVTDSPGVGALRSASTRNKGGTPPAYLHRDGTRRSSVGSLSHSRRGSVLVQRSKSRRQEARARVARVTSNNPFIDYFWYGNKVALSPGGAGGGVSSSGPPTLEGGLRDGDGAECQGAGRVVTAASLKYASPAPPTPASVLSRRASVGAAEVQRVVAEHDAATAGDSLRRLRLTPTGKAGQNSDHQEAMDSPGGTPSSMSLSRQLKEERAREEQEGCNGCWSRTTRCCREWYLSYQARRGVASGEVVLAGRAQEAADMLGLTQPQLKQLRRGFFSIDPGLDGKAHVADFFERFLRLPRTAVGDAIYSALVEDATGESTFGFNDFALVVMIYAMFTEEDILRFVYGIFDENGRGELGEDEFMQLLRVVNHDAPLFPGNFRHALDEFDQNNDGVISFDEFLLLHRKYPQVLWPLFQLQDQIQARTLGRSAWQRIMRDVRARMTSTGLPKE